MNMRRFTDRGLEVFADHLEQLRQDPSREAPFMLLEDSQITEPLDGGSAVSGNVFATRMALAAYLHSLMGFPPPAWVRTDAGAWAWLTLFFFDTVAPKTPTGKRKIGAQNRYIPNLLDFRRDYRHLLIGPYLVYLAHRDCPERANILLCQDPATPGDFVEQIASRQELMANRAIVDTCTQLYYDPQSGKPKKRLGGKNAGSIRRLAAVLNQYDLTWDLTALEAKDLLKRLPTEFRRLLPQSAS